MRGKNSFSLGSRNFLKLSSKEFPPRPSAWSTMQFIHVINIPNPIARLLTKAS